jgi:predicted DNA-binding ribbon-helix-helix protein
MCFKSRDNTDYPSRKRTVWLGDRFSSFSLEDEFFTELERLAAEQKIGLGELVRRIAAARNPNGSVSGAIRLYVLAAIKAEMTQKRGGQINAS